MFMSTGTKQLSPCSHADDIQSIMSSWLSCVLHVVSSMWFNYALKIYKKKYNVKSFLKYETYMCVSLFLFSVCWVPGMWSFALFVVIYVSLREKLIILRSCNFLIRKQLLLKYSPHSSYVTRERIRQDNLTQERISFIQTNNMPITSVTIICH